MKQARVSFVSERGGVTDTFEMSISDSADFGMVAIEQPTKRGLITGTPVFGVRKTPEPPTESEKAAVLSASRAADFLKESGETLESLCELVRAVDNAHAVYNGESCDWICAGSRANYVSFLAVEAERVDSENDTDANEDDDDESKILCSTDLEKGRQVVDEAVLVCPPALNSGAYRAALMAVEELVERRENYGLCEDDIAEFNVLLETYERARWVK